MWNKKYLIILLLSYCSSSLATSFDDDRIYLGDYFEERGHGEVWQLIRSAATMVDYDKALALGSTVNTDVLFKSLEHSVGRDAAIISLIGVAGNERDLEKLKIIIETPPKAAYGAITGALVGLMYASRRTNQPWIEDYIKGGLNQAKWISIYGQADPSIKQKDLEFMAYGVSVKLTGLIAMYMPENKALQILGEFQSGIAKDEAKLTQYEKKQLRACEEAILILKGEEVPVTMGKPKYLP